LEEHGRQRLGDSAALQEVYGLRSIDMRHIGQQYDLNVPVPSGALTSTEIDGLVDEFRVRHARIYGHATADEPAEVVNLRVTFVGVLAKPRLRPLPEREGGVAAPVARRPVVFAPVAGPVDCPIYRREDLRAGDRLDGPCIVEQMDTTVVIEPGDTGAVDAYGNIVITIGTRAGGQHGLD
jgi:N-methylhydantoinase A